MRLLFYRLVQFRRQAELSYSPCVVHTLPPIVTIDTIYTGQIIARSLIMSIVILVTTTQGEIFMSNIASTQARIEENLFAKGKILAAIYDESFNSLLVRALSNEIQRYEQEHGELPKPLPIK